MISYENYDIIVAQGSRCDSDRPGDRVPGAGAGAATLTHTSESGPDLAVARPWAADGDPVWTTRSPGDPARVFSQTGSAADSDPVRVFPIYFPIITHGTIVFQ
jgi:hypothetical protein